jgi:hypothetical protein
MNFFEAMDALEDGDKIKNAKWTNTEYVYLDDADGLLKDHDNKHVSLVMASSFKEDSWELYEKHETFLFFCEVLPLLLEGKRFKKKDWADGYIFLLTKAGHIFYRNENSDETTRWTPRIGDLLENYWVEVANV